MNHIEIIMENTDCENYRACMVNNELTLNRNPTNSKIVKKNLKKAQTKQKMTKIAKSDEIWKKLIKSSKDIASKAGKPSKVIMKQKISKNDDNIIAQETHKTLDCCKHKEKSFTFHIHI